MLKKPNDNRVHVLIDDGELKGTITPPHPRAIKALMKEFDEQDKELDRLRKDRDYVSAVNETLNIYIKELEKENAKLNEIIRIIN